MFKSIVEKFKGNKMKLQYDQYIATKIVFLFFS